MAVKKYNYETNIEKLPAQKIYINVNKMTEGIYEINIINQKKLIKKITFKKQ